MESVCVEAFYLHQAIMDQRAAAVLFDSTFAQVQPSLVSGCGYHAACPQLRFEPLVGTVTVQTTHQLLLQQPDAWAAACIAMRVCYV